MMITYRIVLLLLLLLLAITITIATVIILILAVLILSLTRGRLGNASPAQKKKQRNWSRPEDPPPKSRHWEGVGGGLLLYYNHPNSPNPLIQTPGASGLGGYCCYYSDDRRFCDSCCQLLLLRLLLLSRSLLLLVLFYCCGHGYFCSCYCYCYYYSQPGSPLTQRSSRLYTLHGSMGYRR